MATRTETITLGPLDLPLSPAADWVADLFTVTAAEQGYTVLRADTGTQLHLSATRTTQVTQPFTRRTYHERLKARA